MGVATRRYRRARGGISRALARDVLDHGKIHAHPLTDGQRRYFEWLLTRPARIARGVTDLKEYEPIENGSLLDGDFRMRIITLLNTRNVKDTEQAVHDLEIYFMHSDSTVRVTFDDYQDKPPAFHYMPYRTGSANAHHIRMSNDSRSNGFARDYPQSNTIDHDPSLVSHYTVILLHEFGHVLDKNHVLDDIIKDLPEHYGDLDKGNNNSNEERADLFVQWFLEGSSRVQ